MAVSAELVKLCVHVATECAEFTTDAGVTWQPGRLIVLADSNGAMIPVGSTAYPASSDLLGIGSNFVASYITDLLGAPVIPQPAPAAWRPCGSGPARDVELGCIVDSDPTVANIAAYAVVSIDASVTPPVVTKQIRNLATDAVMVLTATQSFHVDCNSFDYVLDDLCVKDATGAVVKQVLRVAVYDRTTATPAVPLVVTLIDFAAVPPVAYVLLPGEVLGQCAADPAAIFDLCIALTGSAAPFNASTQIRQIVPLLAGVPNWPAATYATVPTGAAYVLPVVGSADPAASVGGLVTAVAFTAGSCEPSAPCHTC